MDTYIVKDGETVKKQRFRPTLAELKAQTRVRKQAASTPKQSGVKKARLTAHKNLSQVHPKHQADLGVKTTGPAT